MILDSHTLRQQVKIICLLSSCVFTNVFTKSTCCTLLSESPVISVSRIDREDSEPVQLNFDELQKLFAVAKKIQAPFIKNKTGLDLADRLLLSTMLSTLPWCYNLDQINDTDNVVDYERIYFDGIILAEEHAKNMATAQDSRINSKSSQETIEPIKSLKIYTGDRNILTKIAPTWRKGDLFAVVDPHAVAHLALPSEIKAPYECSVELLSLEDGNCIVDSKGNFTYCQEKILADLEYKEIKLWVLSLSRATVNNGFSEKHDDRLMSTLLDMSSSGKHPTAYQDKFPWKMLHVRLLHPGYMQKDANFDHKITKHTSPDTGHIERFILNGMYDSLSEKQYLPPLPHNLDNDQPVIKMYYIDTITTVKDDAPWVLQTLKQYGFNSEDFNTLYASKMIYESGLQHSLVQVYNPAKLYQILEKSSLQE